MSGNPQCACSATFLTSDELDAHIEEQKSLKVTLEKSKASISAALGRCSVHIPKFESTTNDKEDPAIGRGRHCPYSGPPVQADGNENPADVECNEVCQCCAYRFRVASKFLRHTPDVSEMDMHQASYATKRRDVIIERVDEELRLAENQKRARGMADDYAETCKLVKLSHVDLSTTGVDHGIASSVPNTLDGIRNALPSDTLLAAAQSINEPLKVCQPITQLTESAEDLAAFEPMPNLTAYNAPIHNEINWLSWIQQTEA
ncbi:hypothetical protein X797_010918 [Metarhizium robertsii]|uniref:Uncharacterized protein n=1 Tax=Metarhizium robertsii TaxID=568076 RepID=A0A0A1UN79_9HYPO|nr:hypothetical protein X797_010918 [Metarhizium robertsii]